MTRSASLGLAVSSLLFAGVSVVVASEPAEPANARNVWDDAEAMELVEGDVPTVRESQESALGSSLTLLGGGMYQFRTDIDSGGNFSLSRAFGALAAGVPLDDRWHLIASVGYDFTNYDFGGRTFGQRDPWTDIQTLAASLVVTYTIDENWTVLGGPLGSLAAENGADFGDALTGGGFVAAKYHPSRALVLQVGATVSSRLEKDTRATPVLGIDWQIDDRWALRSATLDAGSSGAVGIALEYSLSEQWSLAGAVNYQAQRFRLDDGGANPDGVGQNTRTQCFLRLRWKPRPELLVNALAGVTVGGQLRLEDSSGEKIGQEDYDTAPFLGLNLAYRF